MQLCTMHVISYVVFPCPVAGHRRKRLEGVDEEGKAGTGTAWGPETALLHGQGLPRISCFRYPSAPLMASLSPFLFADPPLESSI